MKKTDQLSDYFDACHLPLARINPPADGARHVPISAREDAEICREARACSCDRWGHPCPECRNRKTRAFSVRQFAGKESG